MTLTGKVADLQRLVDAAVDAFGRVDIMVNNAGVETRTSVLEFGHCPSAHELA